MKPAHHTIAAFVALILLAFPAWAESAHPTPADPNNVHGHDDSGVGSGGRDNGVVKATGVMTPPTKITVLPLDQVPAATHVASFSAWSAPAHGVGRNASGGWVSTEAGCVLHASAASPRVEPWSRLDIATPEPAAAVVLVNGWEHDDHAAVLAGTVSINGGPAVAVSGWRWNSALVVPVPVGTAVASVEYRAAVVPGRDSSGVKQIYLWP